MSVEEPKRTLAYICPACRQSVIVERDLFSLAAATAHIKCPCGRSELRVEFVDDHVDLEVPCLFCGREHRSPSKSAVTGRSCYTSKYALSDRLVCGECGTLYRRCTWTSLDRKYPVWRCTSRLNYGTKYCHDSPTIKEEPLQNSILAAINSAMSNKPALLDLIKNAVSLELLPVQGQTMSLADIERRLTQLDERFQTLLAEAIDAEDMEACNARFAEILAEQTALKKQKETILQSSADADRVCTRMKQAEEAIENTAQIITEWNENAVRQIVERVTVLSADEVLVRIKGGAEIKQRME